MWSQALCLAPRSPAQLRAYHAWRGPSGPKVRLPLLLGGPALFQVLGGQLRHCTEAEGAPQRIPGVIGGSENLLLLHLSPGVRPLKKSVLQTALGPEDLLACFPHGRALQSVHIVQWSQQAHLCASLSQRPSWEPAACRKAPLGSPALDGLRNAAAALGDSMHREAC